MIPVDLSKVRLVVGLPSYGGGYHPHFIHGEGSHSISGLLDLLRKPPCPIRLAPIVGDSLVSRARNRIAAKFLASDATHLLFLDTDLIFSAEQIFRLLGHGLPMTAGLYPKKQEELAWVCNTRKEFGEKDPETGLQRVLYAGTGCLLIAREVFEAIAARFPEIAYGPDDGEEEGTYHDFFRVGVYEDPTTGRRRYLSEDWYFCQMAHDAGFELMADTHVVLRHIGEAVYPLPHVTRKLIEDAQVDEGERDS